VTMCTFLSTKLQCMSRDDKAADKKDFHVKHDKQNRRY
jgi:hypothetical protein